MFKNHIKKTKKIFKKISVFPKSSYSSVSKKYTNDGYDFPPMLQIINDQAKNKKKNNTHKDYNFPPMLEMIHGPLLNQNASSKTCNKINISIPTSITYSKNNKRLEEDEYNFPPVLQIIHKDNF